MSPRSAKKLEEIREQSRKKILDAAMELFAAKGFHNTSIEQIRKEAGVSKGLIYNYFTDKEDLMNQIFFEQLKDGNHLMEELEKMDSAQKRFTYIIEFSFSYLIERYHHSKLMVGLSLQLEEFPKLKSMVMGRYTETMPLFAHLMEELGFENPKKEAQLIGAMLDGIGLQYIVLGDALPLDELKESILQKYLNN